MNVVMDGFVYQYQERGGVSRIFNEILPRMCEQDATLRVKILTTGPCLQPLPSHHNIQLQRLLPVDTLLRPHRLWWPILQIVRGWLQQQSLGCDTGIWHSTYYTSLPSWRGPTVVTVFDMLHERFPELFVGHINDQFRAKKHECIRSADRIICISDTTSLDVQQIYNILPDKIRVVPLAHSTIFTQMPNTEVTESTVVKPFFLFVGSRAHYKNLRRLLEAYSQWEKRHEINLVVAGKAWSKSEQSELKRLGIESDVLLKLAVNDVELQRLYNSALALIYPSLYEGFGIPLLEAMACGCPVVASRIPSTLEVAGDCPIYFEATSVESLLVALDTASSEGRNPVRVRQGLDRTKPFTWENSARQTLKIYQELL